MAFSILSLNGGGVRGIFQAVCLAELKRLSGGKPISHCFDLIAGTSTGAIVGLSVALDIDPQLVVDMFRSQGPQIFRQRWLASFRRGSRYCPDALRAALENIFGKRTLGDCNTKVAITATTLNRFRIRVFTSYPRQGTDLDRNLPVVDVVMASCAAPTFFPAVQPAGEARHYVDGGMWANSPSLVAVMQAHSHLSVPFPDMRLLSVGTGRFPEGVMAEEFGALRPISPTMISSLFDMSFATQSDMACDFIQKLIGKGNLLELDADLREFVRLDDVARASRILPGEAEYATRERFDEIKPFLKPENALGQVP